MCGITGIYAFNEIGRLFAINLQKSMTALQKRGPDQRGSLLRERVSLGHTRLSILDLSPNGKQPMSDPGGRYHLIFNGEIYNYKSLRENLKNRNYQFRSESDTEVLLYHLIEFGTEGLQQLNGFFAFAFYDEQQSEILLARDRFGIKPLYYSIDNDKFLFSSELSGIKAYKDIKREINPMALLSYLELHYIPAPLSIYEGIEKLLPGKWLKIGKGRELKSDSFYRIHSGLKEARYSGTYEDAKDEIRKLLGESVSSRLVADVPLGTFLSGGIDSSIITGFASEYKEDLNSFSVAFPDYPYYDESKYATEVAKHFGTRHHTIEIRESDLLATLEENVNYFSEPFADSSAIAYQALSKYVQKHLKVALSGDGADELFGGYMKHQAWQMVKSRNWKVMLANLVNPVTGVFPKSRSGKFSDMVRRVGKLAELSGMNSEDAYFSLCKISQENFALELIHPDLRSQIHHELNSYLCQTSRLKIRPENLNEVLYNDMKLVLPNDMLMKADHCSMANGLEVRVPFLDHELVDFVFTLPSEWKANSKRRKQILTDTFRDMLPKSILNRPKHGFEVPLQKWLNHEYKSEINNTVFNRELIEDSGILNWNAVSKIKYQLGSGNPGDSPARVWALYMLLKKTC